MFQISRRADYALRIMIELGVAGEQQRLQSREISNLTAVPKAFLHKISADLVKAGLVRTYSGPNGGLTLNRSLPEINLLHILEAVEGPLLVNICQLRPGECPRDQICPGHDFWGRLQASIGRQLEEETLEKMVAEVAISRCKGCELCKVVCDAAKHSAIEMVAVSSDGTLLEKAGEAAELGQAYAG